MAKKLTLLDQAVAREKELHIERLNKLSKGKKNNLDLLSILLPKYQPQPKQELFHASNAYEKGLKGGYGSGKTIALCAEAIALAFLNRPLPVIIASMSEEVIGETTYRTLKELCHNNELAFEYQKTTGKFEIHFGSQSGIIYLIGQIFYKGPNIAAVGLDEPFSQRRETYENLIARVRNPKAKRLEVFWSGTAEPQDMEWGTEYFEKDTDTEKLFTITIPTGENKFLPKSYIKGLEEKYDAKTREVYLEGKYVMLAQNRVYHSFERKRNVKGTEKGAQKADYAELILSFDFNVDPMTAVLVAKGKGQGAFYQAKEWCLSSSNTKELCAAVIAYLKNAQHSMLDVQRTIIITGDATGRKRGTRGYLSDYEIIRDEFTAAEIPFYFNIPSDNPAVRDRVNFTNKLFESERLLIDENCTKTIKDLELVSWKQSGEGFIIDKSKKDLTHLSDALGYAVYNNQILFSAGEGKPLVSMAYREKRF